MCDDEPMDDLHCVMMRVHVYFGACVLCYDGSDVIVSESLCMLAIIIRTNYSRVIDRWTD